MDAVEKSDTPVVPKKLPNKGANPAEAMEGRGVAKGNAFNPPADQTQSWVPASMGIDGIREAARKDKRMKFTALLHHITPALLVESFYELKRNAATGIDGVSWTEYEGKLYTRVHDLHREIHTGSYRAQASRRVYIPKADGKLRPLGIAALEDKIVQQSVVKVLSAIYEEQFLGFSYGFRRGKSQHDALDALYVGIQSRQVNWILDADIVGFFDNINHDWLMQFLGHRIADQRLLRLIGKWLKAGVIDEGKRIVAERGTPQGAVISPLLSNIYLHYVQDLWAQQWRQRHATGQVTLVRYADDSVAGFERKDDAERYLAALQERLAKFGLALHPGKTRLIEFGRYAQKNRARRGEGKPETFDFLGFTHCCGKTRKGWFTILRVTIKKRMRATLKAIRAKLRKKMHDDIPTVGKWLKSVVQGYFNYFAVPGNAYRLCSFRSEICRTWRRMLKRRSQRHHLSWERFNRLVDRYIPAYRNSHPYPDQRFHVNHPRQEPCAVIPLAGICAGGGR
ncbi:MAG: group II intron reverse transcriptase/maturase [Oxalobacteraceae bacterium]|nr:group II intron reverse transcriptase/maturase [Oxalobacteraceae bacterium]